MTQIFTDEGKVMPATVLSAGPVVVTQVKTPETDGYTAVQVGYGHKSPRKISKAVKGHVGEKGNFTHIKEFRADEASVESGASLDLSQFTEGDTITLSALSKGKGFQGTVKRYNFGGGPRTHGQKHSEREPGSIGSTGPQRVFKGTRMAGRMGTDRVTLKKVKILKVLPETGELIVKGAVPGRRGTLIEIRG